MKGKKSAGTFLENQSDIIALAGFWPRGPEAQRPKPEEASL